MIEQATAHAEEARRAVEAEVADALLNPMLALSSPMSSPGHKRGPSLHTPTRTRQTSLTNCIDDLRSPANMGSLTPVSSMARLPEAQEEMPQVLAPTQPAPDDTLPLVEESQELSDTPTVQPQESLPPVKKSPPDLAYIHLWMTRLGILVEATAYIGVIAAFGLLNFLGIGPEIGLIILALSVVLFLALCGLGHYAKTVIDSKAQLSIDDQEEHLEQVPAKQASPTAKAAASKVIVDEQPDPRPRMLIHFRKLQERIAGTTAPMRRRASQPELFQRTVTVRPQPKAPNSHPKAKKEKDAKLPISLTISPMLAVHLQPICMTPDSVNTGKYSVRFGTGRPSFDWSPAPRPGVTPLRDFKRVWPKTPQSKTADKSGQPEVASGVIRQLRPARLSFDIVQNRSDSDVVRGSSSSSASIPQSPLSTMS